MCNFRPSPIEISTNMPQICSGPRLELALQLSPYGTMASDRTAPWTRAAQQVLTLESADNLFNPMHMAQLDDLDGKKFPAAPAEVVVCNNDAARGRRAREPTLKDAFCVRVCTGTASQLLRYNAEGAEWPHNHMFGPTCVGKEVDDIIEQLEYDTWADLRDAVADAKVTVKVLKSADRHVPVSCDCVTIEGIDLTKIKDETVRAVFVAMVLLLNVPQLATAKSALPSMGEDGPRSEQDLWTKPACSEFHLCWKVLLRMPSFDANQALLKQPTRIWMQNIVAMAACSVMLPHVTDSSLTTANVDVNSQLNTLEHRAFVCSLLRLMTATTQQMHWCTPLWASFKICNPSEDDYNLNFNLLDGNDEDFDEAVPEGISELLVNFVNADKNQDVPTALLEYICLDKKVKYTKDGVQHTGVVSRISTDELHIKISNVDEEVTVTFEDLEHGLEHACMQPEPNIEDYMSDSLFFEATDLVFLQGADNVKDGYLSIHGEAFYKQDMRAAVKENSMPCVHRAIPAVPVGDRKRARKLKDREVLHLPQTDTSHIMLMMDGAYDGKRKTNSEELQDMSIIYHRGDDIERAEVKYKSVKKMQRSADSLMTAEVKVYDKWEKISVGDSVLVSPFHTNPKSGVLMQVGTLVCILHQNSDEKAYALYKKNFPNSKTTAFLHTTTFGVYVHTLNMSANPRMSLSGEFINVSATGSIMCIESNCQMTMLLPNRAAKVPLGVRASAVKRAVATTNHMHEGHNRSLPKLVAGLLNAAACPEIRFQGKADAYTPVPDGPSAKGDGASVDDFSIGGLELKAGTTVSWLDSEDHEVECTVQLQHITVHYNTITKKHQYKAKFCIASASDEAYHIFYPASKTLRWGTDPPSILGAATKVKDHALSLHCVESIRKTRKALYRLQFFCIKHSKDFNDAIDIVNAKNCVKVSYTSSDECVVWNKPPAKPPKTASTSTRARPSSAGTRRRKGAAAGAAAPTAANVLATMPPQEMMAVLNAKLRKEAAEKGVNFDPRDYARMCMQMSFQLGDRLTLTEWTGQMGTQDPTVIVADTLQYVKDAMSQRNLTWEGHASM